MSDGSDKGKYTNSIWYEDRPIVPRSPLVAGCLSLLAPGLGWSYLGRLSSGVVINLLAVFVWFVGLLFVARNQLFPVLPIAFLLVGHIAASLMVAYDAASWSARFGERFRPGPLGRAWVYAAIWALSFALPMVLSLWLVGARIWTTIEVDSAAMSPSFKAGDTLLLDRRLRNVRWLRHGDIVCAQLGEDSSKRTECGRLVGMPGDSVAIVDGVPVLNSAMWTHLRPSDAGVRFVEEVADEAPAELVLMFEDSGDLIYPIWSARSERHGPPQAWTVDEDEVFILFDNRSVQGDSREWGGVGIDDLIGGALYVWADEEAGPVEFAIARFLGLPTSERIGKLIAYEIDLSGSL